MAQNKVCARAWYGHGDEGARESRKGREGRSDSLLPTDFQSGVCACMGVRACVCVYAWSQVLQSVTQWRRPKNKMQLFMYGVGGMVLVITITLVFLQLSPSSSTAAASTPVPAPAGARRNNIVLVGAGSPALL
jgi:hypothetical protein